MGDLILLVPDKNTEFTVKGAIERWPSLGIEPIVYTVLVEEGRDGGVRRRGSQILGAQRARYEHAVMLLDYEGCGTTLSPDDLEADLDQELSASWGENAKAIVISPEVDIWMWGAEDHLRALLNWQFQEGVREWLVSQAFVFDEDGKPERPKEALERLFFRGRTARSSAVYRKIASRLSLTRCTDPAFLRLRAALLSWFGTVTTAT